MIDLFREPRLLRRHAWLVLLLLAGQAAGARAASMYQCVDGRGAVSFQDRPCAASADQSTIVPAPAPAASASPEYATGRGSAAHGVRRPPRANAPRRGESTATSYECRAADGQVFYRHSACPRAVAAVDQESTRHPGRTNEAKAKPKSVAVTATRITREEACYELRRAGAASRRGRSHDQDVSTYDKNLGRDPCR